MSTSSPEMTSLPEELQLHREDSDECDLSSEEESVPEDSVHDPSTRFVVRGPQNKDSARAPENNKKQKDKDKNKKQKDKGEQLPAGSTSSTTKRTTNKPPPKTNPNNYNVKDVPEVPKSSRGCIIM